MAVPEWVTLTLAGLGAKASSTNVAALEEWAQSEGMPAASNNPLAASDMIAGATMHPGWNEPWYPSQQAAADLYVKKLKSPTYTAIGFALFTGQNLSVIYQAIHDSPWCSGCQGGKYPIVMYEQLHGGSAPVQSTRQTIGPGGIPLGSSTAAEFPNIFRGWTDLRRALNVTLVRDLKRAETTNRIVLHRLARLRRMGVGRR